MHTKALNHLAKALAHRFAGWRNAADLEALSGLPDGELRIDVLQGSATHSSGLAIGLQVSRELEAWFADQCLKKGIGREEIESAALTIAIDTAKVKTDRRRIVHFDFRIDGLIRASGASHTAHQDEDHVWHDRSES